MITWHGTTSGQDTITEWGNIPGQSKAKPSYWTGQYFRAGQDTTTGQGNIVITGHL